MSLNGWLAGSTLSVASAEARAALAWRRITDRPTSITIRRGSGASKQTLAAQTVRVEWDNSAVEREGIVTTAGRQHCVVFGVKDHETITDTNIKRADRFSINGVEYEVIAVMTPPGEVQAVCETVQVS